MSEQSSIIHIPIQALEEPINPDIPVIADIGINAVAAAMMSGLREMMKEGGQSFEDFRTGKIDEKQFTYRMVHKASNAAMENGVRTGSALALSEGAKGALAKLFGQAFVKRLGRYNLVTAISFGLVDQGKHTMELVQGKIDSREYKVKSVENVGGTGGAISGATAGAVLGSLVPGLGTVTGGMLGYMCSMIGAMGGTALGKTLAEKWWPNPDGDDNNDDDRPSTPFNRIDIPIGD
ncbi:MAG: hypothetical protein AAF804_20965 [Bacteroidota bacterium]